MSSPVFPTFSQPEYSLLSQKYRERERAFEESVQSTFRSVERSFNVSLDKLSRSTTDTQHKIEIADSNMRKAAHTLNSVDLSISRLVNAYSNIVPVESDN